MPRRKSSHTFWEIIDELDKLRSGDLPKQKWYKEWSRWRDLLGRTREYRVFRAHVYSRADGYCERVGCDNDGEHVHHKIPVYKDFTRVVDPTNGQLLCPHCHDAEHKAEGRISNWRAR